MCGLLQKIVPKLGAQKHSQVIEKLIQTTVCTICHDYMYVPVMTACGHNYCYYCISNWLNNNSGELSCPQCRASISTMPALNVTLQQNLDSLLDVLDKSELEVTALLDAKEECLTEYKNDLANNELYRKVFDNTAMAVIDDEDGVARCSNCNWEVEGPVCPHCNARMRNRVNEDILNSDEYSEGELEELHNDVEEYRVRSAELIQNLEAVVGNDSDESLADALDRRFPIRQPRDFLHSEASDDSSDNYSDSRYYPESRSRRKYSQSDEDESDGDLDGFIVSDEREGNESEDSNTDTASSPVRLNTVTAPSISRFSSDSDNSEDDSEIELLEARTATTTEILLKVDKSDKEQDLDSMDGKDSDYYEHHDEEGFVSGDSLDDKVQISSQKRSRTMKHERKRKFMVIESDEE
ncbi:HGR056Cp [Eremothecium sinecaudum]|uniref:HGR056Cp n=1 Tax=Eremothecium sinecaudum TaxID=45286 RepID=A0A120K2R8_9SACH|nr:HGR056Cp [Eremothecium sinecaudum]AMD22395.1 HGR056Cp [Eremothecium sinecaudum]